MAEKQKVSPIVKYGGGFILALVLIGILAKLGIIPTAEKPTTAPRAKTPSSQVKAESLEYKLATIEKGFVSRDDIIITRFKSLLEQLDEKYFENKQDIADLTVRAQEILRDKSGINESLLNIMEGMNRLFYVNTANLKYLEYATAYITLRDKGDSHDDAMKGLQAILQDLGIY